MENDDWLAHVPICELYGSVDLIGKLILKGTWCGWQAKLLDERESYVAAEVSLLLLSVVYVVVVV